MKTFARFLGRGQAAEDADEGALKLLAQVHYKWSKWEKQLITESTTGPSKLTDIIKSRIITSSSSSSASDSITATEESFKGVLDGYLVATSYDKSWHKAWHEWALTNFELASVWERNSSTSKTLRA